MAFFVTIIATLLLTTIWINKDNNVSQSFDRLRTHFEKQASLLLCLWNIKESYLRCSRGSSILVWVKLTGLLRPGNVEGAAAHLLAIEVLECFLSVTLIGVINERVQALGTRYMVESGKGGWRPPSVTVPLIRSKGNCFALKWRSSLKRHKGLHGKGRAGTKL